MKPWEFWRLTPGEFADMAEGYSLRAEHEMTRLAWHAMNVINVHLKKKVTVDQLLGKKKGKGGPMSKEDREAEFAKLQKLLSKGGE